MTTYELMQRAPVIPVLVIDDPAMALPLASALVGGGLPVLEVTLRTPAAWQVVKAMQGVAGAVVGIGTVTRAEQLRQASDAGAAFVVTPGATLDLLEAAKQSGLPTLPGVMTPSEAIAALNAGFDCLKFFPAQPAGGVAMLKSLYGPLPGARFCPTGGVGPDNLADYLALPNVICVGGSWVAPPQLIGAGDWEGITALAQQAVAASRLASV